MSCVPCLECGDGSTLTRENLDRWTDSLANVLATGDGRSHFKRYLESRSLDESMSVLEFWEQCSRIMPKKNEGGDSPPHPSTSSAGAGLVSHQQSSSSYTRGPSHTLTHIAHSQSPPPEVAVSGKLHKELEQLVDYADNYLNFDLSQMRSLYQMTQATDIHVVVETLVNAKQSAMELLRDDYQLFRKHLLQNHGLLYKR